MLCKVSLSSTFVLCPNAAGLGYMLRLPCATTVSCSCHKIVGENNILTTGEAVVEVAPNPTVALLPFLPMHAGVTLNSAIGHAESAAHTHQMI